MPRLLLLLPLLLAGCADETAPRFEPGALETNVTASTLTLRWPSATDDQAVERYAVRLDGEEVASLGADARSYVIEGLDEASRHQAEVQAFDAAGNGSWVLRRSIATLDVTGPTWPEDAALTVAVEERDGDRGVVVLAWPEAEDAAGVSRYRVSRAGIEVAELDAGTRTHRFALGALEATRFAVIAEDPSENPSSPLALAWEPPPHEAPVASRRAPSGTADRRLVRLLGTIGGGEGGAIADVLRSGTSTGNLDDALRDAEGIGVARDSP